MDRLASRWLFASLLPLALLPGCGRSDEDTPTDGTGGSAASTSSPAGAGGAIAGSSGSQAGAGGKASPAGAGGAADSGGTGSGNAGSGNAGSGNAGSGNAGSGNAGSGHAGSGHAGSAGQPAGGGAGSGGAADGGQGGAGQGGQSGAGAGGAPTSCEEAHGNPGCCSADGMTNYYSLDGTVTVASCDPGTACTWLGSFYACAAGPMTVDPSGVAPFACGGPPLPLSVSNCSVVCKVDADCASMITTTVCDAQSGLCVECLTAAHCKNSPQGAFCNPQTDACVACLADADCTGGQGCHPKTGQCFTRCQTGADCPDPQSPACDPVSGICNACKVDADCATSTQGPRCNPQTGACASCVDDFDCQDAAAPACAAGACVANSECTGDDASEDKDDGPLGATDITPISGDKNSVTGHKICGLPSPEADYFTFTAADGDSVTLSLSWSDPGRDLDLSVTDAQGDLLGLDFYRNPAVITLDYLPAGAYFFSVRRYDTTPDPAATPYTVDFSRTRGNKCVSIADCAKDGANALLRGSCNAAGACEDLVGQGKVAQGKPCDSGDDCASKICAVTPFNQDASRFAFCTIPCAKDAECGKDQVCTTVFQNNFCTARCTRDSDCVADTQSTPTGSEPWAYLTCDPTSGACSQK